MLSSETSTDDWELQQDEKEMNNAKAEQKQNHLFPEEQE